MTVEDGHIGGLRHVLMIVPAFPPDNTSATARPMHFARHLPSFGYWPLVLAQTGIWSYPQDEQLAEPLEGRCEVVRTGLATRGFVRLLSRPLNWCATAVRAGRRLHVERGVDLIWATSPSILHWYAGVLLARLIRRPLVLDVRDPVTYGCLWHPRNAIDASARRFAEQRCLASADRIVHASPLTLAVMAERSGRRVARRMVTILNGYSGDRAAPVRDEPMTRCTFLYAGKLERGVREPRLLLDALKLACRERQFAEDVRLEMIGDLGPFAQEVDSYGLSSQIRRLGYRSSHECLARMAGADVLVLLQTLSGLGSDVISGKAYEYLAARKPILGVVPAEGGDAWLMRQTGNDIITGLRGPEDVAEGLLGLWRLWRRGALGSAVGNVEDLERFDRRHLSRELADVFDQVLQEHRPQGR